MAAAIDDVRNGFKELQAQRIVSPVKTVIRYQDASHEDESGAVLVLPAGIADQTPVMGAKLLGALPANVSLGAPRATGLYVLFDGTTKRPLAIMDAQVMSAMRTGAVSALAAEALVDPKTQSVGLIGAGVNMRTQLMGVQAALPALKQVKVYATGPSSRIFAQEMGQRLGIEIVAVASAEAAVAGQPFVITAVSRDHEPVIFGDWLAPGVTVFNIGGYELNTQAFASFDRVVVDDWRSSRHRGVQSHAIAWRQGELDEQKIEELAPILSGKIAGRTRSTEAIYFSPVGLGFEDLLLARRIYQTAVRRGLGQLLPLWDDTPWI